jgi:hypothetical protein
MAEIIRAEPGTPIFTAARQALGRALTKAAETRLGAKWLRLHKTTAMAYRAAHGLPETHGRTSKC